MSNLFSTKTGRQEDNSYTGKVLSAVRGVIADARNSTSLTEVSKSLGLESMTESQIGSLNTALETVTAQTAKMVNSLGFEGITTQQQNSMVAAAISMADMRGFASRGLEFLREVLKQYYVYLDVHQVSSLQVFRNYLERLNA